MSPELCKQAEEVIKQYGKRPERLLLYWTAEAKRSDALMEFSYSADPVEEAAKDFDEVVENVGDPALAQIHAIQDPAGKAHHFCFDPGWGRLAENSIPKKWSDPMAHPRQSDSSTEFARQGG